MDLQGGRDGRVAGDAEGQGRLLLVKMVAASLYDDKLEGEQDGTLSLPLCVMA